MWVAMRCCGRPSQGRSPGPPDWHSLRLRQRHPVKGGVYSGRTHGCTALPGREVRERSRGATALFAVAAPPCLFELARSGRKQRSPAGPRRHYSVSVNTLNYEIRFHFFFFWPSRCSHIIGGPKAVALPHFLISPGNAQCRSAPAHLLRQRTIPQENFRFAFYYDTQFGLECLGSAQCGNLLPRGAC